jgi:hypothetical protein
MEDNIKLGVLKTILVIMILLVLAYVWKMDYESLEKRRKFHIGQELKLE